MNYYSMNMESEEPEMKGQSMSMKAKYVLFYSLLALCIAVLFINLIFLLYAVSIIVIKKPEHVDLI